MAGSPRRGGNSETLLDRALDGVREAAPDAVIEKVVLDDMRIGACKNCGYCEAKGVCRFAEADDMKRMYELIDSFDRFIVASPIFFGSLPAQVKVMFDRCQPYWARKFLRGERHANEDREALFLCVGGFDHDRFYKCCRTVMKVWCVCLDIKLTGDLFYKGIDGRGAIEKHPKALEEALAAGRALAS